MCTHEQWQQYLTAASNKCSLVSHSAVAPRIEQTAAGGETTVWWVYASGTREPMLKIVRSGANVLSFVPKLRPHQILWCTPMEEWTSAEIRRWGWPKNIR